MSTIATVSMRVPCADRGAGKPVGALGKQIPRRGGGSIAMSLVYSAASNNGTWVISGTSTMPLSVMRISGMTDSGIRLKPM